MGKFDLKVTKYFLFLFLVVSILFVNHIFSLIVASLFLVIDVVYDLKKSKKDKHKQSVKSSQLYLNAFENISIYAKLNSKYRIIHANRKFCQILHVTKSDIKKINFKSLLNKDAEEIFEILKYNQTWEGTISLWVKNEEIFLEATFIPEFDKKDKLKEIFFFATDITELKLSKNTAKNTLYQDSLTKIL